jgi:hypothetical protein
MVKIWPKHSAYTQTACVAELTKLTGEFLSHHTSIAACTALEREHKLKDGVLVSLLSQYALATRKNRAKQGKPSRFNLVQLGEAEKAEPGAGAHAG